MFKDLTDVVNFATSSAQQERYATPEDRLVKGNPEQNNTLHFSAEEKFFVGEWGAEIGCWKVIVQRTSIFIFSVANQFCVIARAMKSPSCPVIRFACPQDFKANGK